MINRKKELLRDKVEEIEHWIDTVEDPEVRAAAYELAGNLQPLENKRGKDMKLKTPAGKDITIPEYIMKSLDEFGNTVISNDLFKNFGSAEELENAFAAAGTNVNVRITKNNDVIIEKIL